MNNDILHFENELRVVITPPNARVDFVNRIGNTVVELLSRKKNFSGEKF